MIYHTPQSWKMLKSCQRRAQSMGEAGDVDPSHPLAAAWSNAKLMADGDEPLLTLIALDWFATKVDGWLETHMLRGDASLRAMLHEWRQLLFIDATKMPDDFPSFYQIRAHEWAQLKNSSVICMRCGLKTMVGQWDVQRCKRHWVSYRAGWKHDQL